MESSIHTSPHATGMPAIAASGRRPWFNPREWSSPTARKPRVGRVSPGVHEKFEMLEGGGTAPEGVACESSRPAPLRSPARSNLLARAGAMHASRMLGPSLPRRSLFRSAGRDAGWYAGASDAILRLRGASLLTYRAESAIPSLPTKWRRCFSFPSAEPQSSGLAVGLGSCGTVATGLVWSANHNHGATSLGTERWLSDGFPHDQAPSPSARTRVERWMPSRARVDQTWAG